MSLLSCLPFFKSGGSTTRENTWENGIILTGASNMRPLIMKARSHADSYASSMHFGFQDSTARIKARQLCNKDRELHRSQMCPETSDADDDDIETRRYINSFNAAVWNSDCTQRCHNIPSTASTNSDIPVHQPCFLFFTGKQYTGFSFYNLVSGIFEECCFKTCLGEGLCSFLYLPPDERRAAEEDATTPRGDLLLHFTAKKINYYSLLHDKWVPYMSHNTLDNYNSMAYVTLYDKVSNRILYVSFNKVEETTISHLELKKGMSTRMTTFEGDYPSFYSGSDGTVFIWKDYIYCFGVERKGEKQEMSVFRALFREGESPTGQHSEFQMQLDFDIRPTLDNTEVNNVRRKRFRSALIWEKVHAQSRFCPPRLFDQKWCRVGKKVFFYGGRYTHDTGMEYKNCLFSFDLETREWEAYTGGPAAEELPCCAIGSLCVWQVSPRKRTVLPGDTWHPDAITKLLIITRDSKSVWSVEIQPDLRRNMKRTVNEALYDVHIQCSAES